MTDPENEPNTENDVDDQLETILRAFLLKDEGRTGWQLRGVDNPESVAGHTWGVALFCLLYADHDDAPAGVDPDRALRMAVVHDLAEAETGDFATRADSTADTVDPGEKEQLEEAAITDLFEPFDEDGDLRAIWDEYETRASPTARFVKDMDLVDMCFQAVYYEREERYDTADDSTHDEQFAEYEALDEFFATATPRIRTEIGRRLLERARESYEAARERRR
ncbi:HD domain-containing protein [Halostagnicola sp. A-GB9-2]|uniref:HD domain-containing protein n=1 Tax=Halostagnicola sp. A-GB9-2 TaxID=3048066 RepID=UPI0024BFB317|nr:HD domain-containing protein [Halostagnicola sp. A-GB9-2]MDJ1431110.1 HD domain-containing protein [Halostagnicola sp. A-GB9-2]